jgi:folate-binding protein YgfZ
MLDSDALGAAAGTLIDHGKIGWLRITGPERDSWLQGIITADVMHTPGGAFWGLLLDRTGKIRHEVIGIEDGECLRLCSLSQGLESLAKYLDSMLVMEDVNLELEPDSSFWSLHGLDTLDSPKGINALACGRLAWLTPADWVYAVSMADQAEWLANMAQRGFQRAAESEWERLRIAAGVPAWGVDYSGQDTPHHAGLFGRAVATNKGCYLGQEVVCKVEMRGHVSQRIARLLLDSADGVVPGSPVTLADSGEPVGTVTSVAPQSPGDELVVFALARVKTAALDSNPELRVGGVHARYFDASAPVS